MEYKYKVKTKDGSIQEGTVDAKDENAALSLLQERELTVMSLEQPSQGVLEVDIFKFFNKPKTKEVVAFTRQLSTLVEADIPLVEGINTLAQQTDNKIFGRIIADLADKLKGGTSLSGAFAGYPELFSKFYVKIVRAGELSGKLQESLLYLADYLEKSQNINSKIRNALVYPVFVVFTMIIVAFIMAIYVLPQLLVVFKESGATNLPISTRALIAVTEFVNSHILLIILALIVAVTLIWQWIKTPEGQLQLDIFKVRAPLFGSIMKALYLSRIAENMATLTRSDVEVLDVLRVSSEIVGNHIYSDILLNAEEAVRGGGSISQVFKEHRSEIPALMTSMIAIGEQTSKLAYMLDHVSKFYRAEADTKIESIASLIEPVLVVILGLGVAILVASILLPIYSMTAL